MKDKNCTLKVGLEGMPRETQKAGWMIQRLFAQCDVKVRGEWRRFYRTQPFAWCLNGGLKPGQLQSEYDRLTEKLILDIIITCETSKK